MEELENRYELNRLSKNELVFELSMRKINVSQTDSVDNLRKLLRKVIKEPINTVVDIKTATEANDALKLYEKELSSIQDTLEQTDSPDSPNWNQIITKFLHIKNRIYITKFTDEAAQFETQKKTIEQLLVTMEVSMVNKFSQQINKNRETKETHLLDASFREETKEKQWQSVTPTIPNQQATHTSGTGNQTPDTVGILTQQNAVTGMDNQNSTKTNNFTGTTPGIEPAQESVRPNTSNQKESTISQSADCNLITETHRMGSTNSIPLTYNAAPNNRASNSVSNINDRAGMQTDCLPVTNSAPYNQAVIYNELHRAGAVSSQGEIATTSLHQNRDLLLPSGIKIKTPHVSPRTFDGQNMTIECFLKEYEQIGTINMWRDEIKIHFLPVYLQGWAQTVYKNITRANPNIDWTTMKTRLSEFF